MSLLYCNYGRMSSVLTFYCVSISRILHTRYGWFWARFYFECSEYGFYCWRTSGGYSQEMTVV